MRRHLPALALVVMQAALPAAHAQQAAFRAQNGVVTSGGPTAAARALNTALPGALAARTAALSAWNVGASLAQARGQHAAAALNGKIYVWGGYSASEISSLEIYNPATNTWSAGAPLPQALRGHAHAVGNNGLLYSFSGVSGSDKVSSSYSYNPATNVWTTLAPIPVAVWEARATTGTDGRIYVLGGENNLYGNQIYNPTANTWTTGAPLPITTLGAAVVTDGSGRIHLIGGATNGYTAGTTHYVYNPVTDTWATAAALPTAIAQAGCTLGSDGKIYVIGGKGYTGNNSAPFFQSAYVYTPASDTWATDTSLPVQLGETKAVTLGSSIYTLAGCNGIFQSVVYRASLGNTYTWTGATSTAWALGSNWAGGVVPTATDNAIIPTGLSRYPVVSTAATAANVVVISGASLSLTDGSTLTVTGNWINDGTFNAAGNSTVALAGTAAQSLGGGSTMQLRNLTVGAAGATLTGRTEIQRLLTLNGNLATNGQQFLILSNNVGSGMVYNNGGVVTGSTMVQRYIDVASNADFGYRHFAPAVSGGTFNTLNIFPILPGALAAGPLQLNTAYNSAAQPGLVTPYPTVFSYDQSRVGAVAGPTGFDQGWQSPAVGSTLVPTAGFTINEPAGNFLELTGTSLNNGPFTRAGLTRTTADGGWALIGNPYPAPIDWNRVGRTNVDAAAYVYRSTGRYDGGYAAYVNGVGSNVLPMGQAFFVRVSTVGVSGSVAFTNASRETTFTDPTFARPARTETRPLLQLALRRAGTTAAGQQDDFYVYEQSGATPGFDSEFDALKVQLNGGDQPSLYQVEGAQGLAIQGLPAGSIPRALALGVQAPAAGTYEFSPAQLVNFAAGEALWLEDKLTGTWHDLRQGAYATQLSQGLSTARFVLHLHEARPLATKAAAWAGELQLYPNPAANAPVTVAATGVLGTTAELVLTNSLGQSVWQQTAVIAGRELRTQVPVAELARGVYQLQVRSAAGVLTRKLVLR
ncbi:kelch repeat-containing protein [Hymenobacter persicinus]|uniref:T9SS type A sorting domain-containing protein n=1 Tax=Hymenobacter persicinus TaxID=2025506 RepID=A0A4V1ZAA6_9BACT|nr:kelch repeat-containing protein [Hymenobacter persicinus]RYU76403.1 T9SS type A sorting domain-containing protein [Hymenobacter persicinus]